MMSQYLPLTEYANKYKVSISTLRRRIKAAEIKYRFEDGKYLILDEQSDRASNKPSRAAESSNHHSVHRPSPKSEKTEMAAPTSSTAALENEFTALNERTRQEPILSAANRLLTELKKAYTQVLQEKEEIILSLKEEVSDLKTLVRVLESENARGKATKSRS